MYVYIYIYIYWQHFFVNTNFIKHNCVVGHDNYGKFSTQQYKNIKIININYRFP